MIVKGPLTEEALRVALASFDGKTEDAIVVVPAGRFELVANRICRSYDTPPELRCQVRVENDRDPYEPEWELQHA